MNRNNLDDYITDHHGEDYRTFIHLSRAWYGPSSLAMADYVDEVMLGFHEAGGEIAMRWYVLSNTPTPRLELFNDSFRALAQMPDLVQALAEADNVDFAPDEFCWMLSRMGFRDATPIDDDKHADLKRRIEALIAEARK